jgi:hypothetical protein
VPFGALFFGELMEIEKRENNIEVALNLKMGKKVFPEDDEPTSNCSIALFDTFFDKNGTNQTLLTSILGSIDISSEKELDIFSENAAKKVLKALSHINVKSPISNLRLCCKKYVNDLGEFCYKKYVDVNDFQAALGDPGFPTYLHQIVKTFLMFLHPHFNPLTKSGKIPEFKLGEKENDPNNIKCIQGTI